MPVVESAMTRGFLESEEVRDGRAERMFVAAVVQIVISGPVGGTPMPEIMMSAVRLLSVRAFLQSAAERTSPWEMVRWVSMVDGQTPLSKRRAVSLDGLRTTEGLGLADWFGG